jgi:hypothetical protein
MDIDYPLDQESSWSVLDLCAQLHLGQVVGSQLHSNLLCPHRFENLVLVLCDELRVSHVELVCKTHFFHLRFPSLLESLFKEARYFLHFLLDVCLAWGRYVLFTHDRLNHKIVTSCDRLILSFLLGVTVDHFARRLHWRVCFTWCSNL